jgi:hypothetical protein
MRENTSLLVGAAQCVCKPVEALLRVPGTWGERYMNFQAVLGLVFCLMFPAFYPGHDPRPMAYLALTIVCFLIIHRIAGIWRRSRGYQQHSRYSGRPWLKGKDEVGAKTTLEPLALIVIGMALLGYNLPLGAYLAICGIALWIDGAWQVAADNARLRDARDARIDAEWMQARMEQ